jgi:MoaA/NifB/PqqE/SkfB family radical SAM enzyme
MSGENGVAAKLNLDLAKRYVGEQVVRQILNYLEGNPDQNIPRLFRVIEALPLGINAGFKKVPHDLRMLYEQNPVYRTYFNSIFTDLDRNVRNRLVCNFLVNTMFISQARRDQVEAKEKIIVPMTFLIDPTSACNLNCTGCWAGAYTKHDELEPELLDRILNEAKDLGIYTIVMSGGEPFIYPYLLDMVAKHNDIAFMIYTNGTRIDDAVADRLRELGNISPAISLEGWEEQTDARRGQGVFNQITAAMRRLRERGVFFGASLTITSQNVEMITSDAFMDFLIAQGVRFLWSFHYIPIGRQPDTELVIRPEQRAYLAERIPHLRKYKPLPIADFWNDGELTSGCIAGGRSYFHINARGDVEPCAFAHFAVDNIRDKSLLEVLHSPFFAEYQRRQYFSDNKLRPCPIIDNPQVLRKIVQAVGAHATHEGAETLLGGEIGAFLDQRSADWKRVSDPIWKERQKNKSTEDQLVGV